jgi:hypothetical protein
MQFCSTVTFPITVVPLLGFARGWALWRTGSVESAKSETVFMLIHGETVKIQFFIQVNVKLDCTAMWLSDCWGGVDTMALEPGITFLQCCCHWQVLKMWVKYKVAICADSYFLPWWIIYFRLYVIFSPFVMKVLYSNPNVFKWTACMFTCSLHLPFHAVSFLFGQSAAYLLLLTVCSSGPGVKRVRWQRIEKIGQEGIALFRS